MTSSTLLVVAHPDDEALWFTSVLTRERPVELVVATCGEDPVSRERRRRELASSCELYEIAGVTVLDNDDVPGSHLDLDALRAQLRPFAERPYAAVYTHGPLGETFEHPHHQDVCLVVHELFDAVWATSWNQLPQAVMALTEDELRLKQRAIGTLYQHEYARLRPAYEVAAVEKFARHPRSAVASLYHGAGDGEHERERHERTLALARRAGAREPVKLWRASDLVAAPPPGAGFVELPRAALRGERDLVVLAGLRSRGELYGAFAEARAAQLISDLEPGSALAALARDAAALGGYRPLDEQLVEPRFETLRGANGEGQLDVYRRGAALVLWQRTGRRPLAARARRRLRDLAARVARRARPI